MATFDYMYGRGSPTSSDADALTRINRNDGSTAQASFMGGWGFMHSDGTYVAHNYDTGTKQRYDSTFTEQWASDLTEGVYVQSLVGGEAASGFYAAGQDDTVKKFDITDGSLLWSTALVHDKTTGIMTNGDAVAKNSGTIYKFDSSTGAKTSFTLSGVSGFGGSEGALFIDSNDYLWITTDNQDLVKVDLVNESVVTTVDSSVNTTAGVVRYFSDGADGLLLVDDTNLTRYYSDGTNAEISSSFTVDTGKVAKDGKFYHMTDDVVEVWDIDNWVLETSYSYYNLYGFSTNPVHPDYELYPSAWSTTETVTAAQVTGTASMKSPTATTIESATATPVGVSASMSTTSLTEFASATTVGAAATMDTPAVSVSTGATPVGATATMANPTVITNDRTTATTVSAAATMQTPTVQENVSVTASPVGVTATPNTAGVKSTLVAATVAVTATMANAGVTEFASAITVGSAASMNTAHARLPRVTHFSDGANTGALGDSQNSAGIAGSQNRAPLADSNNEVN